MTPLLLAAILSFADSTPRPGETIVFVGDSITQAGDYVADVEAYLLACRPSASVRIVNVGKSSETVSGTSEPDHHPPRPCIHDRFARDVAAFKPNVVVACYGMNDGNYFPFDADRFEKYKAGMTRFIDRVFKQTPARALVLLTPPAFDHTQAPKGSRGSAHFGYKNPYQQYDDVLRTYSDWLLTLRSERVDVVDVHATIRRSFGWKRARYLTQDGVHPTPWGHRLMAQALLTDWTLRPAWTELTLDLLRPRGSLSWERSPFHVDLWTWKTPPIEPLIADILPFERPQAAWITMDRNSVTLFEQRVRVQNLPTGLYDVALFGGTLEQQTSRCLAAGVRAWERTANPVGRLAMFSVAKVAAEEKPGVVTQLVKKRRQDISSAWLAAQNDRPFDDFKVSVAAVAQAEADTGDDLQAIRRLLAPRSYEVQITQSYRP